MDDRSSSQREFPGGIPRPVSSLSDTSLVYKKYVGGWMMDERSHSFLEMLIGGDPKEVEIQAINDTSQLVN